MGDAVAHDPKTLSALVLLLQKLIEDPVSQKNLLRLLRDLFAAESTRTALLDLLVWVFKDEDLARLTGQFLLKGLADEEARRMLDAQVAALVSKTVLDDEVQKSTGIGINKALRHSFLPSWLSP